MSDYYNVDRRLVNLGLNLRDNPDVVQEGFYTRLINITPTQEGSIATRPGRTLLVQPSSDSIHTLFKIDNTIISGSSDSLYRDSTPFTTTAFNGNPLTWALFNPIVSTSTWAYLADGTTMRKVSTDGSFFGWGIEAPTSPAGFAANGAGNLNSSVAGGIVYDWIYTYYSSATGAESNPSPTAPGIALTNEQAIITFTVSPDPQVDKVKFYRRGGSQVTTWRLVGQISNVATSFVDNNADSAVALTDAIQEDNFVPFTSSDNAGDPVYGAPVPYVWGPFIGKYLFGAGDPNHKGDLYWTNPERPDSADVSNHITVTSPQEPLLSGLIYSSLPYVWTRSNLYAIDFGGPNAIPTFTSRKTPVGRGLAAPYAFDIGGSVVFVSGDGIYETDCQSPARSLTEENLRPIFLGVSVEGIDPINWNVPNAIRIFYAGRSYHFFYQDTGGVVRHFVYDIFYQRWHEERTQNFTESVAYYDAVSADKQTLTGATNGAVNLITGTQDNGVAINASARVGSEDFGLPQTFKELGNILLDADPNSTTITVTPLLNGETSSLVASLVTGTGRSVHTLPIADQYLYNLGLDLSWTGVARLYQLTYLYRPDEEAVKHWEFPPTSHGYPGWQHVRDVYIGLRSTTDVTLTVEIDGTPLTYTIPSTGGEKRKVHVWLRARKGKLFRYSLDASEAFRVYGEDCEVRVKSWNTALGYQLTSPFALALAKTPART